MVISFVDGVRPSVRKYMRTISEEKLMTDYAIGPGGSLKSLDLFLLLSFGLEGCIIC